MDLAAHAATDKPGGDGSQALAAGEGWRTIATDVPRGTQRESAQSRALTWYRRALPALTGVNKTKAEKRIAELERSLGPVAQGNLPLYPPGPALLLTFEADTLALAGTRLTGVLDASGSGLRFPASGVKPVRGPFGIALEFDGTGRSMSAIPSNCRSPAIRPSPSGCGPKRSTCAAIPTTKVTVPKAPSPSNPTAP
jgi:hypothetical protein